MLIREFRVPNLSNWCASDMIESNAMSFVEIPVFEGFALRQWIDCLSDYFDREHYMDLEKMNFAQSFMEGEARSWFQRRQSMRIFQNWDDLRDALFLRFGEENDPDRIRLQLALDREWKHLRESKNKWIHDPQHEVPFYLSEPAGAAKSLGWPCSFGGR